jgi:hypothetical protein
VLPEWINRNPAVHGISVNGDNLLNFVSHPRGSLQHDTYTLSPSLVNQFSASFNRIWIPLQNPTTAGAYPQKAGIKGLPPTVVQLTFPDINFSCTNSPGSWQGTNAHFFNEAANTFTLQDNVMWVKGSHSLLFGFQYQGTAGQRELPVGCQLQLQQHPNPGVQFRGNFSIRHRQFLRKLFTGCDEQ